MPPAHTDSAVDSPTVSRLFSSLRQHAQASPWLSFGLGVALLAILGLLGASMWNAVNGDHSENLHLAVLGGLAGFGATALGAVLAVVLRDVSEAGVSGQGPSGAVPKDMSIAQLNEATFAKQVAEQLNEDALKNRYAHLVLIADPTTLGRIRPLLHKETQARLLGDIAKDLTNAPLADIQKALAA